MLECIFSRAVDPVGSRDFGRFWTRGWNGRIGPGIFVGSESGFRNGRIRISRDSDPVNIEFARFVYDLFTSTFFLRL